MDVFKSRHRRKWRTVVNSEFRKRHGVDLRTVGEMLGPTTLHHLLNDEYELAPQDPAVGMRNVTLVLAHVYRVDIASLALRDLALTIGHSPEARELKFRSVFEGFAFNSRSARFGTSVL